MVEPIITWNDQEIINVRKWYFFFTAVKVPGFSLHSQYSLTEARWHLWDLISAYCYVYFYLC